MEELGADGSRETGAVEVAALDGVAFADDGTVGAEVVNPAWATGASDEASWMVTPASPAVRIAAAAPPVAPRRASPANAIAAVAGPGASRAVFPYMPALSFVSASCRPEFSAPAFGATVLMRRER
ncbi:MAG: hypothetical protein V7706_17510 [Dietzia psychralcaliphila]